MLLFAQKSPPHPLQKGEKTLPKSCHHYSFYMKHLLYRVKVTHFPTPWLLWAGLQINNQWFEKQTQIIFVDFRWNRAIQVTITAYSYSGTCFLLIPANIVWNQSIPNTVKEGLAVNAFCNLGFYRRNLHKFTKWFLMQYFVAFGCVIERLPKFFLLSPLVDDTNMESSE